MFDKEFDENINEETLSLVEQYEEMRRKNENRFFEHETYEQIIEYYEENNKPVRSLKQ